MFELSFPEVFIKVCVFWALTLPSLYWAWQMWPPRAKPNTYHRQVFQTAVINEEKRVWIPLFCVQTVLGPIAFKGFWFVCLLFYNFKTRKSVNKVTFPKVVFLKMSYRTSQRKDRWSRVKWLSPAMMLGKACDKSSQGLIHCLVLILHALPTLFQL